MSTNTVDPKVIESIKTLLKSKDVSDASVAANLFFNSFGDFDPDRDMEIFEHIMFTDDYAEPMWTEFLNEYATLIVQSQGIKVEKE